MFRPFPTQPMPNGNPLLNERMALFAPLIRNGFGRGMGRFGRRPSAFGRFPRNMQGGQRPGGRFPMKANGVPNAMAAGFGQGPRTVG